MKTRFEIKEKKLDAPTEAILKARQEIEKSLKNGSYKNPEEKKSILKLLSELWEAALSK
jgi:hypothetical protein